MLSESFEWVDLAVVGLALDIAGALVLAWSFSTKTPSMLRAEVPRSVRAPTTFGNIHVRMPQGLVNSLVRQRAEARLGLSLLCTGFAMQASIYMIPNPGSLSSAAEREFALVLVVAVWCFAWVLLKKFVPWQEKRMHEAIEAFDSAALEERRAKEAERKAAAEARETPA